MQYRFMLGDEVTSVRLGRAASASEGTAAYHVTVGDREHEVEVLRAEDDGTVVLRMDGRTVTVHTARSEDDRWIQVDGQPPAVLQVGARKRAASRSGGGDEGLSAVMHSQVVGVPIAVGDTVARGDALIVLEAMKMESRITAPHDAKVKAIHCREGDVVEPGVPLVELESLESE